MTHPMRLIVITLALLLAVPALAQVPKGITPANTAKWVGKRVTVEFVARSHGFNDEGEGFHELGSEMEFENNAWFALRFSRKAMAALAKKRIHNLGYFVGDKVVATGVVREIDFGGTIGKRRVLYIEDLRQFLATPTKPPAYTPTKEYKVVKIRNFTVLFHPEVVKHAAEFKKVSEYLDKDLGWMEAAIPKEKLAKLRQVRIWMEWDPDPEVGAAFHEDFSATSLKQGGKNPDKAGDVEVLLTQSYAADFATMNGVHRYFLIHEFAHAYHHYELGGLADGLGLNGEIKATYSQAMERKLYDRVKNAYGKMVKAYAAKNEQEYFAELSNTYFGGGTEYPFNRADLRKHDPVGYKMVQRAWGVKDDPKVTAVRQPDTTTGQEKWVPLFNGKDLTGWKLPENRLPNRFREIVKVEKEGKVVGFDARMKNGNTFRVWRVENGELIGSQLPTHLFSERGDYTNFALRAVVKINDRGNSGVYFRSRIAAQGFPTGYEAQINCGDGDRFKTGSLFAAKGQQLAVETALHKADEYFTLDVTCIGETVTVAVNGKKTGDWKDPARTYSKGHFALQCHDASTVVTFKSIEVRELP